MRHTSPTRPSSGMASIIQLRRRFTRASEETPVLSHRVSLPKEYKSTHTDLILDLCQTLDCQQQYSVLSVTDMTTVTHTAGPPHLLWSIQLNLSISPVCCIGLGTIFNVCGQPFDNPSSPCKSVCLPTAPHWFWFWTWQNLAAHYQNLRNVCSSPTICCYCPWRIYQQHPLQKRL